MAQMDRKKIRILNRLCEEGFDTEKKVRSIDLEEAYDHGFSDALQEILELKKAIKDHRVISYLLNGSDETEVKNNAENREQPAFAKAGETSGVSSWND